ncbi:MAG: hypothetical protein KAK04_18710 [Cyclobacteriaceae bacterium]|nr:hypothetical protein [Cyclobacteriaceae bacterium]
MTDVNKEQNKSAQINKVLGLFVLYFGTVIIVATFFTDTFVGQMTNLVAGIVLSAIFIFRGLGIAVYTHAIYDILVIQEFYT